MSWLVQWPVGPGVDSDVSDAYVRYQLGGARLEVGVRDIAEIPFETCDPVRDFPTWPRKRHYSGQFFMQRLQKHVAFESLSERSFLVELDRSPEVTAVSSQPMWLHWSDAGGREHAPDFFIRLASGEGVLADVRPESRIDDRARKQFDVTALFSREVGWHYVVHSEQSRVREANLRFLLRYRHPMWADDDAARRLRGFRGTLSEAAALLGSGSAALGKSYALIWHGLMQADLDLPLGLHTRVWLEGPR